MKTQYPAKSAAAPKLVQNTESESIDSSNKPTLLVDRLSITLEISDEVHRAYVLESIYDMTKESAYPFHTYGWAPGNRGSYKTALRLHFPNPPGDVAQAPWAKTYALVQAGPKSNKGGFMRIDWNPARLTALQTEHLFSELNVSFGLGADALLSAKITRIDIAVDVPGFRPGDYVWERPKSPVRNLLYKKGELETLYLGTIFKGQVRIYDKAKEQGNHGQLLTRIELQQKPNCPLGALPLLKNPLASLRAFDVLNANLGLTLPHKSALLRAGVAEGVLPAFADFPLSARTEKLAAVRASTASIWQPTKFWAMWPAALERALPLLTSDLGGTLADAA
jgi:hypothetical protein